MINHLLQQLSHNKVMARQIFYLKIIFCEERIVDTGASNHITGSFYIFANYRMCDGDMEVTVARRKSSTVTGLNKRLYYDLQFKVILQLSTIQYKLLYVTKLTDNQNCSITFWPIHCELQELSLGKMFRNAEEQHGSPLRSNISDEFSMPMFPI